MVGTAKEVLVIKNELTESSKGKRYCKITYREKGGKTGVLSLFNNFQAINSQLPEKEVYWIEADWDSSFPNVTQFHKGESERSIFSNYLFESKDYALGVLNKLIDLITDEDLKELNLRLFTDEVKEQFIIAPAAIKYHHAECGGLLQHTREVMEFIYQMMGNKNYQMMGNKNYQMVDFQVALEGALLHDLAKLREYRFGLFDPTEITMEYLLGGHLSLGAEWVGKYADGLSENKISNVKHIIRSHHYQKEWDAVVNPATLEAHLVYLADSWSATLNRYNQCVFNEETRIGEVSGQKFVNLKD